MLSSIILTLILLWSQELDCGRYLRYPMQFLDTNSIFSLLIGDDPKNRQHVKRVLNRLTMEQ